MEKVLYVRNNLAIDLGNLLGFSVPVIDHDERLKGVDAGIADAASFPASLLDELSGSQFHIAGFGGVGYQVGKSGQEGLVLGFLHNRIFEETARAPDFGDVGEFVYCFL